MPHVVANGVRFHTFTLGDSGPPVVMLHGLLVGNLASWYFTGARVLSETHRVFLYDLRGHGKSDKTVDGYTVQTMSQDLSALLSTFTDEPVALVGHSFGGLIGLQYALDHPDKVSKLAIVEAPIAPSRTNGLTGFLSLPREQMVAALPDTLRELVFKNAGSRRVNRLLKSLYFLAYESTLLADIAGETDVSDDELKKVSCPTLLVYGRSSSCIPGGERLAQNLPDARYELLDGGHYLTVDAPDALSALLVEFLGG